MQLVPRYLVKNKINIISNDAGLLTEYRPVYQRTIKISRGVDNLIQFKLLNADQKPVPINRTPMFVAFDENMRQVFEKVCDVLDDGSTRNTLGVFTVKITDADLLDLPQQYLKYNVYLLDNTGDRSITYANAAFDSAGIIYVDGASYPGPKPNYFIDRFYQLESAWIAGGDSSDSIAVMSETSNTNKMHTAVVYPNDYQGTLTIQGTLDGSVGLNWFDIQEVEITGSALIPINFTGGFTFVRFKLDNDPTDNTPHIVLRK